MNISGNFNTAEREIAIVKTLLDKSKIKYNEIYKNQIEDDSDVIVVLGEQKITVSVEIKEEKFDRFKKYHDLGIDYISSFKFKPGIGSSAWKGSPKSHRLINEFENSIIIQKHGKIEYSKADAWLFYCVYGSNVVYYDGWFLGADMTSLDFKNYLKNNCFFAVNNKPNWQMSRNDFHQSAVFFINIKDTYLLSLQKSIFEIFKR